MKRRKNNAFSGEEKPKIIRKANAVKETNPREEIMRLNKYIAYAGVCSRRQAVELVKNRRVTVNGKVVVEPWYEVKPNDIIALDNKLLKTEDKKVYILMNKPKNVVTTSKDERGRRTVLDLLENKIDVRVYPVGRLDRTTLGLLLLTNDGELAQRLAHPSYRIKKIYHATLNKPLEEADLVKIQNGLTLEDGFVKVDAISYITGFPPTDVGVEVHIGRNRIVRRIFEHLGYEVVRLDRTYYAGLTKKNLPRGYFRHLTEREVLMLKHFT